MKVMRNDRAVSDGNGGSDSQAIAVSIIDQNEPGTGNLVAAINIDGGTYTVVESGINYVADPGPGTGTITYRNRSSDPIGGAQDDDPVDSTDRASPVREYQF